MMTAAPDKISAIASKLLMVVVAFGLATVVVRFGVASATFDADGRTAMQWNAWDARSMARRAIEIAQTNTTPTEMATGRALATSAIRRDPTIADSYSALGLIADRQGDPSTARKAFLFANRTSKRNLAAHLWLIQDAVARDDSYGALEHFDLALRSSDLAAPILFPVLVRATEEPRLIEPIVTVLKRQPDWARWYMGALINTGTATDNILKMLDMLRSSPIIAPPSVYRDYAKRLVVQQDYRAALSAYALAQPSGKAPLVRNSDFRHRAEDVEPFGWVLTNETGFVAEIAQREEATGPALMINANADAGGTIARQLLVLPTGAYRLAGSWRGQPNDAESFSWRLICAGQSTDMARAPFMPDGTIAVRFVVPPDNCPAQALELTVTPSRNAAGKSAMIKTVRIYRDTANK
jgi:hypothetical protein